MTLLATTGNKSAYKQHTECNGCFIDTSSQLEPLSVGRRDGEREIEIMSHPAASRALLSTKRLLSGSSLNFCTKSGLTMAAAEGILVERQEMKSFITRCMEKVGTEKTHAEALADVLVAGDYRGHFSHGLNRLGKWMRLLWAEFVFDSFVEWLLCARKAAVKYEFSPVLH